MDYKYQSLTNDVIKVYYRVYNKLGQGFLEKVYERAMLIELKNAGINATSQQAINVFYEDAIVGEYIADIVVENKVILEIKAIVSLTQLHEAQLMNYLKATRIEVGLLLNFGPMPVVKRRVFDNIRK